MLTPSFKQLALGCAVAAAALTLAACHSSDHDSTNVPPVTSEPNPNVTADSFITIVKALLTVTNESAEPSPIDGVTTTAPESTEPEPTS